MRFRMILVGLPAVLLLSACAKKLPEPTPRSDIALPERWTALDSGSLPVTGAWWETFGQNGLNEVVAEALANNRSLRAAAARLDAARAQARIAGADLLPAADAGLNASRRRQNFVGFPIPGAERRVLSSNSTNVGVSLNVSWEADLWGRIRDGIDAAAADAEALRADLRGARQSLAAQASKTWFALVEVQQQMALTDRTLKSYKESAERLRLRYEAGLLAPLDLRLALTNVHSVSAQLEQQRDRLQRVKRQIEVLLGRYPAAEIEPDQDLPDLPEIPPTGVPAELLSRRPDLVAAEWRLASADSRLAEAHKSLYPRLSLTSSLGTAGASPADVFDPRLLVWSLLGNLTQPVFQGGRLRAGVDAADARLREAASSFADTLLASLSEVESALAAESLLARREEEIGSSLEQARGALRLAQDQYDSGLQTYIAVLEAQRRVLAGETLWIAVRRERLDNRIDLHLALGGGFQPASVDPSHPDSGGDGRSGNANP